MLQNTTASLARLARHAGVASMVMTLAISPAMARQARTSISSPDLKMQTGERGSLTFADVDPGDVGPDSIRPPNRLAEADPDDVGPDSIRPPNSVA